MDALRAIAEPRRQQILRLLVDGEMPAGRIAEHFDVSRPAVSQHLHVLLEAGLVSERKLGRQRLYQVRPESLEQLRQFIGEFWDDALSRLSRAAEAEQRRREV